jgi:inhibitor of KinA sporulation pathway (predicted exonuclease)
MADHCMVDLETLSTLHNARILSIGAVLFNKDGIFDEFYRAIRVPNIDCLRREKSVFDVSDQTLLWWSEQSEEAKAVFWDPEAIELRQALEEFSDFLSPIKDNVLMWGNGASFDNAILSTAYNLMGLEQPWKFWNDRCFRTIKNMFLVETMKREGTHHNALDDARFQAQQLLSMKVL